MNLITCAIESPYKACPPLTPEARWLRYATLLAIDPGEHSGWALMANFDNGWVLQGASVVRPSDPWTCPLPRVDVAVIEFPKMYPQGHPRPNDLLKLAATAGRWIERLTPKCKHLELVYPRDWKGTVDGDTMLRRIEEAFSEHEERVMAAVKGQHRHNAVDAVGFAKWAVRQPWMRYKAA